MSTELVTDNERCLAINKRWAALPSISDCLPIRFPCGSVLTCLVCSCVECHKEVPPEDLRVHATRPLPDLANFEGWGFCRDCRLLTPFACRVRGPKLQLEWQDREHGWLASQSRVAEGLLARAVRRIQRMAGLVDVPPNADLVAALRMADTIEARDLLSSGWAEALNAEFGERGLRQLRPATDTAPYPETVALVAEDGTEILLGVGLAPESEEGVTVGALGPAFFVIRQPDLLTTPSRAP